VASLPGEHREGSCKEYVGRPPLDPMAETVDTFVGVGVGVDQIGPVLKDGKEETLCDTVV